MKIEREITEPTEIMGRDYKQGILLLEVAHDLLKPLQSSHRPDNLSGSLERLRIARGKNDRGEN
jgi:hypothetical protein